MKFPIPFCSWTGRAALEIEIPDSTKKRYDPTSVTIPCGKAKRMN